MVTNNGLAAFDRQWIPIFDVARFLDDVQISYRDSQGSCGRHGTVLKAVDGGSRHRSGL